MKKSFSLLLNQIRSRLPTGASSKSIWAHPTKSSGLPSYYFLMDISTQKFKGTDELLQEILMIKECYNWTGREHLCLLLLNQDFPRFGVCKRKPHIWRIWRIFFYVTFSVSRFLLLSKISDKTNEQIDYRCTGGQMHKWTHWLDWTNRTNLLGLEEIRLTESHTSWHLIHERCSKIPIKAPERHWRR